MNLIIIAALVAATVADKLDRTYLPPPSAKTAGGSPGSLKTPFAANSLNGGLGSLPKGSYTNEFQGVVVDAIAPGTRASGDEETGLGAPIISYGSTNSKVGAAAFKTNPSAFGQASVAEGQNSGTFDQGFSNQAPGSVTPERPQAALDRSANTVQFNSEVGPESYSYSFETDNGIVAEENGVANNGVQAQGGFSYTGDDGQVYTVTYTADEGGYQPKGDHLPTPPPIPEDILKSLEKNAKDEAAGLVDDGSYDAQKYNTGGDYADNGDTNGKYSHQSSKFGGAGETDAAASGSFNSQNNQVGSPGQFSSQSAQDFESGHSQVHSVNTQGNSGFTGQRGSSLSEQGFGNGNAKYTDSDEHSGQIQGTSGFTGQLGSRLSGQAFGNGNTKSTNSNGYSGQIQGNSGFTSQLGSSLSGQAFGNRNTNGQSGQIQENNRFKGHFGSSNFGHGASLSGFSQNPEEDSESSLIPGQNGAHAFAQASQGITKPNSQGQTGFNSNRFGQTSQLSSNSNQGIRFGNKNEYLPPVNFFGQNGSQNKRPGFQSASQFDKNTYSENETDQPLPTNAPGKRPLGSSSSLSSSEKSNVNGFSGQFGVQQKQSLTQNQSSYSARPSSSGNTFEQSQGNKLQQNQGSTTNQPSSNLRPTSSATFGKYQGFGSNYGSQFSSKNEYLPPSSNFGLNSPAQKQSQSNNQFNQQYNANPQLSANLPSSQNPQYEPFSNSASSSVPTQQPSFSFTSQTRPQSNGRPNYQSNNRFQSSQSAQPLFPSSSPDIQIASQETQPGQSQNQFSVQKATSQPDAELTTPLEASGSQSTHDASSTNSFNSRPSQSIFGANDFVSTTSFPSFGSQTTPRPQKSGSNDLGRRPAQSTPFKSQSQINSQFGASSSLSQDNDIQGAPSTPRPTFTQQSQGPDDSYYYRQPSKPFGPPQGSRFPNTPTNQFNTVAQRPQKYQFMPQPQSNYSYQYQNMQFQGSSKYLMPPSVAPTVSSQSQLQSSSFSGQYNGITQASISPFPSQAPTQPTQFNQQGQFGRPVNQPMKSFSGIQSRPAFGQPSMTQASFLQSSQIPFVQKPERQPNFQSQQSLSNQPEPTQSASQQTLSQQYNGELYEYNKPPEVVPAPENNEPSGSVMPSQNEPNKFGSQPVRPQPGRKNDNTQTNPQFGQPQSFRPFGGSSRPQFGQKLQQSGFNSQSTAEATSQPQFSEAFASTSTQGQLTGPNSPSESQGAEVQESSSSCCQGSQQSSSLPSSLRPLQGFGSQAQVQFSQSSFPGSQGSRPEAAVSSFAGKGERFGGPRKPPSFDEKTGYHY